MNTPQDRLRHHVTGAIERGEKEAIAGIPSRHTPGPWASSRATKTVARNADIWIADVDSRDLLVAADVRGIGEAECVANARLIAAAPDLLEALEGVLAAFGWRADETSAKDGEDALQSDVKRARAAIAKAKGDAT